MRALMEGHAVTAMLHTDLTTSDQVGQFVQGGGSLRLWKSASIARLQSLRERLRPNFPLRLLGSFDAALVSLGSLPSLCYVPGLVNALLQLKVPYVLFCQFNSDHLAVTPSEREAVRAVMLRSSACIFLSTRNLDEARRQYAVEPPGATLLGNPIRDGIDASLPWPSTDSCVRFASVARFETAWKGQDLLLDVLRQPAWQERKWHLTFYGSGPDQDHLQALVKLFGLETRITFAGFVGGLAEIWANNHVLVLPSHGEGLPLSVLEAMMLGRLVVATDVGGNREVIEEGVTGFIADGATAFSFNQALERAWQARNSWQAIGQRAHLQVADMAKRDPTKQLLDLWLSVASIAPRVP
jgi:glycosyltransferase involved in cell wall biosynthesis